METISTIVCLLLSTCYQSASLEPNTVSQVFWCDRNSTAEVMAVKRSRTFLETLNSQDGCIRENTSILYSEEPDMVYTIPDGEAMYFVVRTSLVGRDEDV